VIIVSVADSDETVVEGVTVVSDVVGGVTVVSDEVGDVSAMLLASAVEVADIWTVVVFEGVTEMLLSAADIWTVVVVLD
jgi:hypothetical protein